MKILKGLALGALLASTANVAMAQDGEVLRIGTEGAYAPFNYIGPDGELMGFDIDIAKALCEEMNRTCEFVTQDWDGMIPGLLAERYDAIMASMSITPERLEAIDFSDKYYNTPPAIAVPNESAIDGTGPSDISGIVIGAQVATTFSTFAEETYPDAETRLYPTAEEYQAELASGRIEAAIDDVVVLSEWLATPEGACCKIVGTLTPAEEIFGPGIGVGVRQGDEELRDAFSEAILAIRENGVYEEINNKYFNFDVYGE